MWVASGGALADKVVFSEINVASVHFSFLSLFRFTGTTGQFTHILGMQPVFLLFCLFCRAGCGIHGHCYIGSGIKVTHFNLV